MKKQSEFKPDTIYTVTLKFEFKGSQMDKVKERIEQREEIKLTNLGRWFYEENRR